MIFNGHSDILSDINMRRLKGEKEVFKKYHYNNFIKSGVTGSIFVIWTDPEHLHDPKSRVKQIINSMQNEFKESKDIINQVTNYNDLVRSKDNKKMNILVGMEGLEHIGSDIDLLEKFYNDIGLRHASLTWNEKNLLASGISDDEGGLSKLGVAAIKKMEELGIVVDVSHLNEKSFWDVVNIAEKPIIASHSNTKFYSKVKRNLTDEQIIAISKTGGLIGVNSVSDFVSPNKEKQNINHLIEHIEHIKSLIGINHIAFGFDFCDFLPESYVGKKDPKTNSLSVKNLSSEADISNLIKALEKRNFTPSEIKAISYKNFYNLLKKIL